LSFTVHQHHHIGDDKAFAHVMAGGAIDAELVGHGEAVRLHIVPGDVSDGLAAPAVPAGQALDRQPLEQQLRDGLIGLHQPALAVAGERADSFGHTPPTGHVSLCVVIHRKGD